LVLIKASQWREFRSLLLGSLIKVCGSFPPSLLLSIFSFAEGTRFPAVRPLNLQLDTPEARGEGPVTALSPFPYTSPSPCSFPLIAPMTLWFSPSLPLVGCFHFDLRVVLTIMQNSSDASTTGELVRRFFSSYAS